MPDGLYDRDILAWSEQQARLLARIAAGERLNEAVDWANVIEEVESVGRSELHACESLLGQALLHLMKLSLEPESLAVPHWRGEVVGFVARARRSFAPSMRQRIDIPGLYADGLKAVRAQAGVPTNLPTSCPYVLDDLLADDLDLAGLVARLS